MNTIPSQNIFDRNFKPEIPASDAMIKFGLEMLSNSAVGIQLLDFMREEGIQVKVIRGPEETSYVAGEREVVIVLKSADPAHPARFILLLTGAIRQIMQEFDGLEQPSHKKTDDQILEEMRVKKGDKGAYMCAVAYEINQILTFQKYHLIEELKEMGYSKQVEAFLSHL